MLTTISLAVFCPTLEPSMTLMRLAAHLTHHTRRDSPIYVHQWADMETDNFTQVYCSGKSAFLFHAAVDLAASGRVVLIVCVKSKAEEVPPPLPCGVNSKDMLLANIHMK